MDTTCMNYYLEKFHLSNVDVFSGFAEQTSRIFIGKMCWNGFYGHSFKQLKKTNNVKGTAYFIFATNNNKWSTEAFNTSWKPRIMCVRSSNSGTGHFQRAITRQSKVWEFRRKMSLCCTNLLCGTLYVHTIIRGNLTVVVDNFTSGLTDAHSTSPTQFPPSQVPRSPIPSAIPSFACTILQDLQL